MSATKVIIGKGACKHPNGRGKPSREFTIDGVGYYFCYGWTNDWGEDISHHCEDCERDGICDVIDEAINAVIETGEYH